MIVSLLLSAICTAAAAPPDDLPALARQQIAELQAEKASRTPAQRKMDSQLVYALRQWKFGQVAPGLSRFQPELKLQAGQQVLVDLKATPSGALLKQISRNGGQVLFASKRYHSIRAEVPLAFVESLAARTDVTGIRAADQAACNGTVPIEGDIAHGANLARNQLQIDGSRIKVGVLSDSVDFLTNLESSGALPDVTVLPGQAGSGSGEGTAMLQIVHQLAPGASLYFATAFNGIASFAQNIRDLRAAGCDIIVDDVIYFRQSPFQDGPISQAVNDVCADGAMFFSAAANCGNKDHGTSTTWQGDFVDGGSADFGRGGRLNDFGGSTYNTVLATPVSGILRADMFWSDPLGASTNDYDLYVIDTNGAVVRSSTDVQDGHQDPYEMLPTVQIGDRLVIVKQSGDDRYLYLSTFGGRLTYSTGGNVRGHNAAAVSNAFSVAAVRAPSPPALFTGGSANPVERFSSDGPRHIFFKQDGTPITPGDYSSTGGTIIQKPDIAAADGVSTAVPGFAPFYGTSAAAPHAAAVAALLWSYDPAYTASQISAALTNVTLDIEAAGTDRDSGAGIVMASLTANSLPSAPPYVEVQNVDFEDANHNGNLEVNECANLTIQLLNAISSAGQTASGIQAVLTTSDSGVRIDPEPRDYPDLPGETSATNSIPFRISTTSGFVCGKDVHCTLLVTTTNGSSFEWPITLSSSVASKSSTVQFSSTNGPIPIPDLGTAESPIIVQGIQQPIADVTATVYVTHTYDSDVTLALVGPDGTQVTLVSDNGGSGQNYGTSCTTGTVFDDSASNSIYQGTAPFVGRFRPQDSFSVFRGKFGDEVNGAWQLVATDGAEMDTGTIQCWSLKLTPYTCANGGGACLIPPSVAQQPQGVTVTNGDSFELDVTPAGTPPFFYQWMFESNTIPGATSSNLVLNDLQFSQGGNYSVLVSNYYGSVLSDSAAVEVLAPPEIASEPADLTATNGDTVRFNVVVNGSEPLTYQWYFSPGTSADDITNTTSFFGAASPLDGATNAELVLSNVMADAAGLYAVAVSNFLGQTASDPVALDVLIKPTIDNPPQDLTVTNGDPAAFSVSASGTGPLYYQWYFAETNLLDGETNADLFLPSVASAQAGPYSVLVSNVAGTVSSAPAELTVLTAPEIVQGPTNMLATNDDTVIFTVLATGSEPLAYRWYFNPSNAPEDATNLDWLVNETNLLADATNSELILSNVTTDVAGNYAVSVSNLLGTAVSDSASLVVLVRPEIVSQPQDLIVTNGDPATFSVSATGTEPLSYQWYWGGTNLLGGETNSDLVLTSAVPAQAGAYSVTISNIAGIVSSEPAQLTVLSAPEIVESPTNLVATNGDTITFTVLATGSEPLNYQWYFSPSNAPEDATNLDWLINETNLLADATNADLVFSNATADLTGNYAVTVSNLLGMAVSDPASLVVLVLPEIVNQPQDLTVTNGDSATFSVSATGTEPLSYQWYFAGTNLLDGETNADLILTSTVPPLAGSYNVTVSNIAGSVSSESAQLTVLSAPEIVQGPTNLIATNGDTINFAVLATGTEPLNYQWYFSPSNAPEDATNLDWLINETNLLADATNADLVFSNATADLAGNYAVTVSNLLGEALSGPANLIILVRPEIVNQPQDLTVTNGDSATFSVIATGTEPLSYQWYFAETNRLDGETNADLILSSATPAQAGSYNVTVSNVVGTVSSQPAQLTVLSAPEIVQGPTNLIATNGDTITFSVLATGTEPLSYQWYFSSSNAPEDATNLDWLINETNLLADATNADLVFSNATADLTGNYAVTVSNLLGMAVSDPASLVVLVRPEIVNQPQDLTVTNGDSATFSVIATGTEPLNYQWYFAGTNLLEGETNADLVLASAAPAQAGPYSVTVSNIVGSVSSESAELTVLSAPEIVESPTNLVATNGDTINFTVLATGTEPLNYQWYFSPSNAPEDATNLDWLINETNALADATNADLVFSNATADLAGNYAVTVSNLLGEAVSDPANLIILVRPEIVNQPQDLTVTNGDSATFSVSATGTEPLNYQWYFGGTNLLDGETNSDLILSPATLADAGAYSVTVSNVVGTVSSQPAQLTVLSAPEIVQGPTNLIATNGDTITFSVLATGTEPLSYQWYFSSSNAPEDATNLDWLVNGTNVLADATNADLVFSNATADLAGNYAVTVSNLLGEAVSDPANLIILARPEIVNQPQDLTVTNGDSALFSVSATGTEPLNYQWYFAGTNLLDGQTNSDLILISTVPAQAGAYSVIVSNIAGVVSSDPAQLTVLSAPKIVQGPTNLLATNGDTINFTVVATGTEPLNYRWYFSPSNAPEDATNLDWLVNETNQVTDATNSELVLSNVTAGFSGNYAVAVSNLLGTAISDPASLTVLVRPEIVNQPQDLTVTNGDPALFSVSATGTEPLNYQWYFAGTNLLDGETNSDLILTSTVPATAGAYSVIVSNIAGSVSSQPAQLTVLSAPEIVQGPTNLVATNGDTINFTVLATGTQPFVYQWYFSPSNQTADATNSTSLFAATNALAGETNSNLILSNVTEEAAGIYAVAVSNLLGQTFSDPASLVVLLRPEIVDQPQDLTVTNGDDALFHVTATGTDPLSYQWYSGTNALNGETNADLLLAAVSPTQAGAYSVVVSNPAGAITSRQAGLTVLTAPAILTQPKNVTIREGGTARFTVSVSGSAPFSFAWFQNDTNLVAETDTGELLLTNVTADQSGNYDVVVSNLIGTATSQAAILRVLVPPQISQFEISDEAVSITFTTSPELRYSVFYKTNLNDPDWIRLPGASKLFGTGDTITVQDTDRSAPNRYYIVLVE